jgi:hypothetical protein
VRYIPHEPSPRQLQFLKLSCREALYGGSAGCGKSDALLMGAIQGINIPTYSAILFRRTFKDLGKPGALMDRARKWFERTDARWLDNDDNPKTWLFPSGARISFGYLATDADLANYQSADFQYIGFDESTHFTGDQVTYMFSRLRRTKGFPKRFPLRMRQATNPGGIGHDFFVKRYEIPEGVAFPAGSKPIVIRDSVTNEVKRVFLPAHAEDNPGLDWEDYRKSLAELTPIRRKQLEEGQWVQDDSGLVYSTASSAIYVDCLPAGYEWDYMLAVDVGATNNCALAIAAVSRYLPEVYILSTSEPIDLNNPRDLAIHIKRLNEIYHFQRITGDHGALGKGYLDEMRKYFAIPIQNAQKQDKRGYIELFNGAVANGMIRFVRAGVETWTRQAGTLLWRDERHIEEMPGMANHSCDGTLYVWREARHYSCDDAPPPRPPVDEVERAEQANVERQLAEQEWGGMALPEWFR